MITMKLNFGHYISYFERMRFIQTHFILSFRLTIIIEDDILITSIHRLYVFRMIGDNLNFLPTSFLLILECLFSPNGSNLTYFSQHTWWDISVTKCRLWPNDLCCRMCVNIYSIILVQRYDDCYKNRFILYYWSHFHFHSKKNFLRHILTIELIKNT